MANVKRRTSQTLKRSRLLATSALAISLFISLPAHSQTVVIGGPGGASVQVNMGAVYPQQQPPYQSAPSPASTPLQDYSKSSRIVDGDEVIQLVPPGSRPKRKPAVKAPPRKKQIAKKVETVEKKPEPTEKPVVQMKKLPEKKEETVAEKPTKITEQTVTAPKQTTAKTEAEIPAVKKPSNQAATAAETTDVAAKPAQEAPSKKSSSPNSTDTASSKETTTAKTTPEQKVVEAPSVKDDQKDMQVAAIEPQKSVDPITKKAVPETQTPPANSAELKQIFFSPDTSTLPSSAEADLKKLAEQIASSEDRVQLLSFADAGSNSAARRLSLGRALVVRSKLMKLGVPNNRIEVRALGKPTDGSAPDRVDLIVIAR
ncbi:OmpA family protein [Sneathiella sp.]|jgi:outer membrane protein OmpA-like peptidoglycan-associated protein|uniref:OmpA family protein n=1 Tax=Sneathiella sp. TaxID=1964365 RepID=UPI0039E5CEB2